MLVKEKKRGERRYRSAKIAAKRRKEHLQTFHFDPVTALQEVHCACDLSSTYFSKRRVRHCHCSKRKHGSPKVGNGICCIGAREGVLKARRLDREIKRGRDIELLFERL